MLSIDLIPILLNGKAKILINPSKGMTKCDFFLILQIELSKVAKSEASKITPFMVS